MVSLADQIELACLVEATVRKPGNVHPAASFVDLCYDDFVKAAGAVSELLAAASEIGLGESIFAAVQATRIATGTNVNLGMILLLAPLAAVPVAIRLQQGIGSILRGATVEDAEQVYAAIRLAHAGGLGTAEQQDIQAQPTVTLREAMAMAADRDRIAEQYVTDFRIVFAGRDRLV